MAKKDAFGSFDPKELRAFVKELDRAKKSSSDWKDVLDGISSTFFGFSASAIFNEVPKSVRQITEESLLVKQAVLDVTKAGIDLQAAFVTKKITDSFGNVRSASEVLGSSLRGTMSDGSRAMDAILSKMEDFSEDSAGMWSKLSLKEQAVMAKKLTGEGFEFLQSLSSVEERYDVVRTLLSGQEESIAKINKELLMQLATHESLEGVMNNQVEALGKAVKKQREAFANSQSSTKQPNIIDMMSNSLDLLGKNFGQKILTNLNEVDKGIHEIQRSTGVMMAENTKGLSRWMYGMAEFGMNIKDVGELMGGLGDELRTTDKTLLMGAVDRFKSLSLALGISSQEIAKIGGEMMRAGHSADDVADSFALANKSAKMLGLNSKSLVKQISNNIEKMRQFGFEGGIKSLTKMAAKAESLRIQVDEIFDVAKRARTIEGAMEMASQLQLAGGSFSNINPMELLSAARKGPEELGKILTTMGADVGHWSDDMKSYEFNPVDVDRLQLVADATGMSLDSIQKVIQKNAQTAKKTELFPDSMFSGIKDMDADLAKSMLGDYLKMGENGEIGLSDDFSKVDLLGKAGIKKYTDINNTTLAEFYKLKEAEGARLEEQAKQNRALSDTFNAFSASLANLFVVFTPVLTKLTAAVNAMSDGVKWAIDELNDVFSGLGDWLIPSIGIGLLAFKTGIFGTLKGAVSKFGGVLFGKKDGAQSSGIAGLAGSMQQASDVSGGIKMGNILKFAGALGIIGVSVIGFMAGLNAIGGTPGLAQLGGAAASMAILGLGILGLSKISKGVDAGGVLKMALAMGIMGAAMIPFAYAMNMMKDVGWEKILATIGIMALSVVALMGLGALLAGPQVALLALGVAALIGVGAGMALAGAGLLVAGLAFEKLSTIKWDGVEKMGKAMLVVAPAMFAFSAASMMFANPITILGIGLMMAQLIGLSAVMIPLSSALFTSSESMEKFGSSMEKMKKGVRGVDLGGVFDGVAESLGKLNEVLTDSDMERVTQALSSIRVNIDSTSVDGLKSMILNMPALVLHVDRSELNGTLSSAKIGLDIGQIEKQLALLPLLEVKLDDKQLLTTLNNMPSIDVKLNDEELKNMASSMPDIKMRVDTDGVAKVMGDLPALQVTMDMETMLKQLSSMPEAKISVDLKNLQESLAMLSSTKVHIDVDGMDTVPMLHADVDMGNVMDKLSSIPDIELRLNVDDILSVVSSISSTSVPIELKLSGVKELTDVLTMNSMVTISVDNSALQTVLSELKGVQFNIDVDAALTKLSELGDVQLRVDVSNLDEIISTLSSMELNVDPTLQKLSSFTIQLKIDDTQVQDHLSKLDGMRLTIDDAQLQNSLSKLQGTKLTLDDTQLQAQLSQLQGAKLVIDVAQLEDVMSKLQSLELSIDDTQLQELLSKVHIIQLGIDDTQLQDRLSDLHDIQLGIDDTQLQDRLSKVHVIQLVIDDVEVQGQIAKLQDTKLIMDVSQLKEVVTALNKVDVRIDMSSLVDQLGSMPKFNMGVDRSEVEKMADLLSSIRVSLDISALESSISGLKVSVDTTQLDRSIAEMSAVNMADIGRSLASIEAKVSKFNEGPSSNVKIVAEDLGSSNNKLQNETLVRITEALERLTTSTNERSGDRRIVVELEMNGRQLKTTILKDTNLLS